MRPDVRNMDQSAPKSVFADLFGETVLRHLHILECVVYLEAQRIVFTQVPGWSLVP